MTQTVVDNPEARRFELLVDGQLAGIAAYDRSPGTMSLTHTEVYPSFEGRGLGSVLAQRALDLIRDEGAAVLPYCPFIRRYIQRHQDYLDLVPADRREQFELGPTTDGPQRR